MTHSLILLRGLPGSGKSSLAKLLCENKWPVFSIDHYFVDPITQVYQFEFDKNHLAYANCKEQTETALKSKIEKVFVDNTFTIDWEMTPYFELAAKYGYQLHVLTVENYHGGKNKHGVSNEQLQKMATKYKVKLF